jgi:hypothetical protein
MSKEVILVTVKTYPALSSTYDETVCTAGMREDGSWIRIYPIPFRKLEEFEKYRKFDWVEIDVEKNLKDPRPESHKKRSNIRVIEHIDTSSDWYIRNQTVLEKGDVYTNFDEIIRKNKDGRQLSLATFKPTEILDVTVELEKSRDWDQKKLRELEAKSKQPDMFQNSAECFKVVKKLPYKFRYLFQDETGKKRELMITDWEIGALFWNSMSRHSNNENKAVQDVKNKYLHDLVNGRDIHFFVGTTLEWDLKNAPNPFTIIGVYSPPIVLQESLF